MPKPEDVKHITPTKKDRARLEAIAVRISEAEREKAAADAKRESAKEDFFDLLDTEFGDQHAAVYGVSEGALAEYRLLRSIIFGRTVDVNDLAKLVPLDALLKVVTVSLTALDAAVISGVVPKGVAEVVTHNKDVAERRCKLEKPAPAAKIKVAAGEIAAWYVKG